MSRTEHSPYIKTTTLVGQRTAIQVRNCMCCGKSFRSLGPGNRICVKCSRRRGDRPAVARLNNGEGISEE